MGVENVVIPPSECAIDMFHGISAQFGVFMDMFDGIQEAVDQLAGHAKEEIIEFIFDWIARNVVMTMDRFTCLFADFPKLLEKLKGWDVWPVIKQLKGMLPTVRNFAE